MAWHAWLYLTDSSTVRCYLLWELSLCKKLRHQLLCSWKIPFCFLRIQLIFHCELFSVAIRPPDQPHLPLISLRNSGRDSVCLVTLNQTRSSSLRCYHALVNTFMQKVKDIKCNLFKDIHDKILLQSDPTLEHFGI